MQPQIASQGQNSMQFNYNQNQPTQNCSNNEKIETNQKADDDYDDYEYNDDYNDGNYEEDGDYEENIDNEDNNEEISKEEQINQDNSNEKDENSQIISEEEGKENKEIKEEESISPPVFCPQRITPDDNNYNPYSIEGILPVRNINYDQNYKEQKNYNSRFAPYIPNEHKNSSYQYSNNRYSKRTPYRR